MVSMSNLVYGVDGGQEITPTQVRDALVECFSQAHCEMVKWVEILNDQPKKN